MLGRSGHSRALAADFGDINRRLRAIERRLEGAVGSTSAKAARTADHVGDTVASLVSSIADRLQGSGIGDEAAKIGNEAARLGGTALRRLSKEVQHRPLVMLAVAVGVGLLIGVASRR